MLRTLHLMFRSLFLLQTARARRTLSLSSAVSRTNLLLTWLILKSCTGLQRRSTISLTAHTTMQTRLFLPWQRHALLQTRLKRSRARATNRSQATATFFSEGRKEVGSRKYEV